MIGRSGPRVYIYDFQLPFGIMRRLTVSCGLPRPPLAVSPVINDQRFSIEAKIARHSLKQDQ